MILESSGRHNPISSSLDRKPLHFVLHQPNLVIQITPLIRVDTSRNNWSRYTTSSSKLGLALNKDVRNILLFAKSWDGQDNSEGIGVAGQND